MEPCERTARTMLFQLELIYLCGLLTASKMHFYFNEDRIIFFMISISAS